MRDLLAVRTRRNVLHAASGTLLVAAMGCGGDDGGAPRPADVKGVAIDFWGWNPAVHPESVALQKVLENFVAKSGTEVKVNFTAPPAGGQAAFEKLVAAVSGGSPPDASIGQHFYLSDLHRQGALLDVESSLKSSAEWKKAKTGLAPATLEGGFTWKGKVYGIPVYSSHFAMYFQPELLKRAGVTAPPAKGWTWEQFVEAQKKAAKPPEVSGYDEGFSYTRTGILLLNNGHRFMSADGTKFSFNSPEALEAIDFQMSLVKQGLMRAHDGDKGGYSEKLPQGQVVFQFGVAARVKTYRKDNVQFGTCYYPVGPSNKAKSSLTFGEAYGVGVFKTKDVKRQQAAWLASLWTTRPDMGLLIAQEAGAPPSYTYTVDDKAFQSAFRQDAEAWPFYDLIPGFVPMPNFPGFGDVRTMGDKMIPDIWSGKANAKHVLDEYTRLAQQKLDEALK